MDCIWSWYELVNLHQSHLYEYLDNEYISGKPCSSHSDCKEACMKSGECGPYLRSGRIPPVKHEDHCSTDKVKRLKKTWSMVLVSGQKNEFNCVVNQVRHDMTLFISRTAVVKKTVALPHWEGWNVKHGNSSWRKSSNLVILWRNLFWFIILRLCRNLLFSRLWVPWGLLHQQWSSYMWSLSLDWWLSLDLDFIVLWIYTLQIMTLMIMM